MIAGVSASASVSVRRRGRGEQRFAASGWKLFTTTACARSSVVNAEIDFIRLHGIECFVQKPLITRSKLTVKLWLTD
jgi:hypothetical protein